MVMGRKQCLRTKELRVADVLYDRPGDGQAIEGTRTAADLIEDKKTVLCGVSQDIRHLCHLNHKRTLAGSQVIGGADSRKDPVADSNVSLVRRDKASDLCHEDDEGCLSHIGGLTGHVRSRDDGDPVLSIVQICIVCDKQTVLDHLLNHRMASVLDVDNAFFVDLRLHIVISHGHRGQGCEHVNARNSLRGTLDPQDFRRDLITHVAEQVIL